MNDDFYRRAGVRADAATATSMLCIGVLTVAVAVAWVLLTVLS